LIDSARCYLYAFAVFTFYQCQSLLAGTTVFCRMWNFEPSLGIAHFHSNSMFLWNSILACDKRINMAYFGWFQATMEN